MALGRWAARSPLKPHARLGVDSLMLSFRTMFDPHAAAGFSASIELRIGEERFQATIAHGRMKLIRGSAEQADAIIEADSNTLAEVVYGGRKLDDALRSGDLKVEGKKSVVKRFLKLFPLPQRAPAA